MKQKAVNFISKYKHAWALSYFFVYLSWFFYLGQRGDVAQIVHCKLDDYIPFCEYFIVPYLLWFLYVAATITYFLFTDRNGFYKCCAFLFTGMTICLIIYTFHQTQTVRPTEFARDNIFTVLVNMIYTIDSPKNACPSIHVFNSIGCAIALWKSETLHKKTWLQICSILLAASICLATVFIKQHSAIDGFYAMLLATVLYVVVYKLDYKKIFQGRTFSLGRLKKDVFPSEGTEEM